MIRPAALPETFDLEKMGQEAVKFCVDLVRINTVNPYSGDRSPGGEAAGQAYLEPILRESGAVIDLFEPPPDIYERMGMIGPEGRNFDNRPNLVATWRFGTGSGPRIVIQGHMDTVGADHMEIDPFSGHIEDGQIWGRGTSDMKGAMGAAVAAIREVVRHAQALDGSIHLLSTVDEECDGMGAGTLACIDRGYRGDVAISIDGNGPELVHGYGGVLTCRIRTHGQAGHAAAPIKLEEKSAMERAIAVGEAVLAFRRSRWLEAGAPSNLGVFQSGTHPATVPHEANLGVNISYHFKEAVNAREAGVGYGGALIRRQFEEVVRQVDPSAQLTWVKDAIPFETPVDDPAIAEMARVYQAVTGEEAQAKKVLAWTDACHLWYHGKMPTMVCGAGSPGRSHSERESVEVWRVETCARLLTTYLYTKLAKPQQ